MHTTCTLPVLVYIPHMYDSYGQSPYMATFHVVINRVR
jgi:hypothetical protein